jgi:hypothetical protein
VIAEPHNLDHLLPQKAQMFKNIIMNSYLKEHCPRFRPLKFAEILLTVEANTKSYAKQLNQGPIDGDHLIFKKRRVENLVVSFKPASLIPPHVILMHPTV